ncbi:TetR family transcriptional regulator [Pseudomonas daroniae]|uniref:TetR family transcriptional regulator n=1 Tax=Phytopseudomonas daroniae TaxID=2487519 RepID=A0A4Q9QFM7_9GAMM|nr:MULTISPECIES: TetR/AcrR family transcriptional regulator [Pseudomonas]TBU71810.1 TetR family transcriptional regulator [Pseudomonas daroniae]TBU78165.1 TetR family transcriptional regulator [Pseudomonas sp. FRB 228]TBU78204.1 TetR family transcriptional regulator [Pseudomonas daroniae]TBU87981.1 TetR family transcriptional regulator [Pseudomonas daroniae]
MSEIPSRAGIAPTEGLRERKRRETQQRIAEVGQRLFLSQGYDSTTLDAIAAEAGISRRTFFSYFKSKDDIIFFWLEADRASLLASLLKTSPDVPPLDAVRDAMVKHIARYTTEQMIAVDNLMLSSESLLARKQAHYAEQEQSLFNALCEVWRQPERRAALRMVAMVSIGAMRVALSAWREQTGQRKPAAKFLRDAFDSLKSEL